MKSIMAPIQRFMIWIYRLSFGHQELGGLEFISNSGNRDEQVRRLEEALRLLEQLDRRKVVDEALRTVVVTMKLEKVVSPYGACFIQASSNHWMSAHSLASLLVWASHYVQSSREKNTNRFTSILVANEARDDFATAAQSGGKFERKGWRERDAWNTDDFDN